MRYKWLACLVLVCIVTGCASAPKQTPDMELTTQAFEAISKGNYEEAEALLEVALSINPENPYALLDLGVVYQKTGRIEEAREKYVRIILLNPKEKAAQTNVGDYKGKTLVDIAKENLENL